MTRLRRHRRDHRARAPKKRKRRNLVKFIPSADSDFAHTASNFASYLKSDPARYGVTAENAAEIRRVVDVFRDALSRMLRNRSRNKDLICIKDDTRQEAEKIVRRFANIIRANPDVTESSKKLLRIKVRKEKLKHVKCPTSPPRLEFIGTGDGVAMESGVGGGSGVHVLKVWDYVNNGVKDVGSKRKAKPDGADRLELFFDFVPPGEPVPKTPWERGGWPKYLGPFTKHQIEVQFPLPACGPMLIVYWGRWANAGCVASRYSKTCVARVEGWTADAAALPPGQAQRIEAKFIFVKPYELPSADDAVDHELIDMQRVLPAAITIEP